MSTDATVTASAGELRDAFHFVSFGDRGEHAAYISMDTGQIYWTSSLGDELDELPEDLEESDRYIEVPHKHDLNLGRRLALEFATQEMPEDYDRIAGYFQRPGAYARFKDLLDIRGTLKPWYEFEEHATEAALRDWCEANGIRLVEGPPVTNP